MISKELKGLEQKVYIEKLNNGLTVYLIPFKNRKNYYIEYITKFGAAVNKFIPIGKKSFKKVPYGIAHFLEHKMFEQKTGETPFEFFSIYGSDANAATGYKVTSYTVEGTNNIEKNLDYLLTYVNSPYFTNENVDKEKNIIIEEINMYNDEPEGKIYRESSKAIFKYHPMRVDIGGTEESVNSITKEDLYDCYNLFYQPNNMLLFIGGNFDIDSVINVIKSNKDLNKNKFNQQIKIKNINEPLNVNIPYRKLKISGLIIPKLILTLKLSIKDIPKNKLYNYVLAVTLLTNILYGSSSRFREEALKLGIMSFFTISKAIIDDFLLVEFAAESKEPEKLAAMVKEYFLNQTIEDLDLERNKKSYIAGLVLSSDRVVSTVSNLVDTVIDYGDIIPNKMDIIKSINLKYIFYVKDKINIDNSSLIIAYPKNN